VILFNGPWWALQYAIGVGVRIGAMSVVGGMLYTLYSDIWYRLLKSVGRSGNDKTDETTELNS